MLIFANHKCKTVLSDWLAGLTLSYDPTPVTSVSLNEVSQAKVPLHHFHDTGTVRYFSTRIYFGLKGTSFPCRHRSGLLRSSVRDMNNTTWPQSPNGCDVSNFSDNRGQYIIIPPRKNIIYIYYRSFGDVTAIRWLEPKTFWQSCYDVLVTPSTRYYDLVILWENLLVIS